MNDNTNYNSLDMALFRFSIISSLLHRELEGSSMEDMLFQLASKSYLAPDKRSCRFSPETIRKWFYRYKSGGLPALKDKERADKGVSKISERIADCLFELREKHPRWTVAKMLEELLKLGVWDGRKPSQSTIYNFCTLRNLKRDSHLSNKDSFRSFEYDLFGALWTADFMHGPKLWHGKYKKKTYLHVILDDCCRFVVAGKFYVSESVETLMSDLMIAVRRFGMPKIFYSDNGAAYKSRHLKIVCAKLGVRMIHTPPYKPQGRGKVERFFRTVRDQFLSSEKFKSVEDINKEFSVWLNGYHSKLHSGIDSTPINKRLAVESCCSSVPEVADISALFYMEKRCKVYGNGTVRLRGKLWELKDAVPGTRETVFYLPWDLSVIFYGNDFSPVKPIDLHKNARRFQHPNA